MEWIERNSALAIAMLGPVLLAAGYFYRARTERHGNLQEALYLLLRIWRRIGLVAAFSADDALDVVVGRVRALYPDAMFTEENALATKAHFVPILRRQIMAHALMDVDGLLETYAKVVGLVARSHPVFAYRLDASSAKRRMAFLDQYLREALQLDDQGSPDSELTRSMREHLCAHAERDVVAKLEENLLGLARHVSISSFIEVHLLIRKRHRQLMSPSTAEVDRLLSELVESSLKDPNTRAVLFKPAAVPPLERSESK